MWYQDNNLSLNVTKTKEMIGLQEKEDGTYTWDRATPPFSST
jgi:hypothetical protein